MKKYSFARNILTPVDNTILDGLIEKTAEKGYSEYNRLYIPNQGIDENGDILHYFPYGSIAVSDKVAVDKKHIFLKNGYLLKPGIVVKKYYIKKNKDGLLLGDEKYFRVIDSNIEEVEKNSLVIVQAGQSYRFNIDKKEYFFVQPDKILTVICRDGIKGGPNTMLLKSTNDNLLGSKEKIINKGEKDGVTLHFKEALYDIYIENQHYIVVDIKDIKLTTE